MFEYKATNEKNNNNTLSVYATCVFYASFRFIFYCGNTRWFKYDWDYLCVNKSWFVLVIFEPPCILTTFYNHSVIVSKLYWLLWFLKLTWLSTPPEDGRGMLKYVKVASL
jgi:hypothetical protein